ncbi:MAG: cysteine desulfurase [Clostridiales bacterium]|nr:cysteine desulfurase [Clostridiales bacterium]
MTAYLDNAATTPVSEAAAQAALEAMREGWGNPSSRYPLGSRAAARLKQDRETVARALGCRAEEVVFTSCGTEGDNWAIQAAVHKNRRVGKHIITTAIEHAAVLEPCRRLEQAGYEVTCLPPDRDGSVSLEALEAALRPDTVLVSMMLVNNELGSVLPVREAVRLTRRLAPKALFHTDAVQGFLKIPFTPKELGVDLLTVSGHKIHAPKGVGALYIRSGLGLEPFILGGGQERGLRSGTEATAQIAALAAACREGKERFDRDAAHMEELKVYTLEQLALRVPEAKRIGAGTAPHILALTLPGYKAEVLVRVLGDMGVCVSAGSACHRGKPSHVYAAMGLSKGERDGSFRVSFSGENRQEEVDALVDGLVRARDGLFTTMS